MEGKEIIYSLNVNDLQCLSDEVFDRDLTELEIEILKNNLGDYIDWSTFATHALWDLKRGYIK